MNQNTPDTTSKSALVAGSKKPAPKAAELSAATGLHPEADRVIAKVTANANTRVGDYIRLRC